jgi:hypothetical protein
MVNNKLYDCSPTFILVGDTNTGVTTMINKFLQDLTKSKREFYCPNCITIFHLSSDRYELECNGQKWLFDDFQSLERSYNLASESGKVDCTSVCHVYLKDGSDMEDCKINIIDMIGKSTRDNIDELNKTTEILKTQFPNHIVINMSREPMHEIVKKDNEVSMLTHVDTINYDIDNTLEEQHKGLSQHIDDGKLFVYTNLKETTTSKLGGREVKLYGKDQTVCLFSDIFRKYQHMMNRFLVYVLVLIFYVSRIL